jgi:hypothetical protein
MCSAMDTNLVIRILQACAADGDLVKQGGQWTKLVPEIEKLVDRNISEKFEPFEAEIEDPLTGIKHTVPEVVAELKQMLNQFDNGPPFTIQRLCELIVEPNKYYGSAYVFKYLDALRSVLSVASSTDEYPYIDIKEELSSTCAANNNNVNYSESGVVMSEISWIVDTGVTTTADKPEG